MDYFAFDLQLFAVDYANSATGNSGDRHAIVLDVEHYYAIANEEAIDAIDNTSKKVQMKTATAVYATALSEDPPSDGTYFFGVDGYLYAQSANADSNIKTKRDDKMASLLRNERGREGYPAIVEDAEKFFMGTVTISGGAVTAVTTFDNDDMWYGETIELVRGATYTTNDHHKIYSIGADNNGTFQNGAVIFQLGWTNGVTTSQMFTVNDDDSIGFDNGPVRFISVLSGNMVVDLSDKTAIPPNFVFPNGRDDAWGAPWIRGKDYNETGTATAPKINQLKWDKQSTSVTFTGLAAGATQEVQVNNRTYTVSNDMKFVRDYGDNATSTSTIATIVGNATADTLVIGSGTGAYAEDGDVAVSGDVDLTGGVDEEGADVLTFDASGKEINIGGKVILGGGDDTVSFASTNAAVVTVTKGISGGDGNDTFDFTNASNGTSIVINDFKAEDVFKIGTNFTVKTEGEGAIAVTATNAGLSTSKVDAVLVSGDVKVTNKTEGKNISIGVDGVTVADDATVDLAAGASAKVNGKTYTNTKDNAPATLTVTDGVVVQPTAESGIVVPGDYVNPAVGGSKDESQRHAITPNAAKYFAFDDKSKAKDVSGTMKNNAGGLYGEYKDVVIGETYFFGADGYLYEMTKTTDDDKLKLLKRNESPGIDNEHFLLGTVTIGKDDENKPKVAAVTTFSDNDNFWYGETVEIIPDAKYTVTGDHYIYSVDDGDNGATVFQVFQANGQQLSVNEVTMGETEVKCVNFENNAVKFVSVFAGDMVADISGTTDEKPVHFAFLNGNDDAWGTDDHPRGYAYGTLVGVDAPSIKELERTANASIKFVGMAEGEARKVIINNRTFAVSNGVTFARDLDDDGNTGAEGKNTGVIKSITGTEFADTLEIGAWTSARAQEDGAYVVNEAIDLGAGDDKFAVTDNTGVVRLAKGVTGGAGNDTYDFTNASAGTSITINDFKAEDVFKLGGGFTVTTTASNGIAVTATNAGLSTSGEGAVLVSGDVKVTNKTEGKNISIGVDGVTVADDATVDLAAGASAKINGKTFTNPSSASGVTVTVSGTAPTVTLGNSGYVTIGTDDETGAAVITDGRTITSTVTGAITVGADGSISSIAADAAFTAALEKSMAVKIGEATYTNARDAVSTLTVTNTAGVNAITLANGDVITVAGESAAITTDIGKITNTGTAAITVAKTGAVTNPGANAAYTVELKHTQTFILDSKTYQENGGESDSTATLKVNNGVVTLSEGQVELAVTGTVTESAIVTDIGTITYKKSANTGDGITVTSAGAVSGNNEAGDDCTIVLNPGATFKDATIGDYTNTSTTATATITITGATPPKIALTAGTLAFDDTKSLTVGTTTTTTITNTTGSAGHLIAVDTSGNVSQIAPGAKFTTKVNAESGASFAYTMTGTTLAKTGDAIGVYTTNGAATVSPAGVMTNGTLKAVTLTLAADNAAVNAERTPTTKYYALLKDGTVDPAAYDSISAAQGVADAAKTEVIGCFKAVTSWAATGGATPAVTVTFVDTSGGAKRYLGNVTVDMTNVQKVEVSGSSPKVEASLGSLVVTGIAGASDASVFVENLKEGAAVTPNLGGVTYMPEEPATAWTVTFDATWAAKLNAKDATGVYTGYGVRASIDGKEDAWYDTVSAVKTAAGSASYTIIARFADGELRVANGGTGKKVVIADSSSALTAARLNGVTVKMVESFDAEGEATDGTGTGVVAFTATNLAGASVAMKQSESFAFGDAFKTTVPKDATVVNGENTYTANAESILTLASSGAATLVDGNVSVAKDKVLKVGSNEYTAKDGAAQILASATYDSNGNMVAATAGTLVSGTAEVKEGQTGIRVIDGDLNETRIGATGTKITVTSAGVVSGLANGQTVKVTDIKADGTDGDVTTYTVDGTNKKITVSGKYVGVYSFASEAATLAATITPVYGAADTVTSMGAAATPVALSYNGGATELVLSTITGSGDSATNCYKVSADGTVAAANTKANSNTGGIGYFQVTTSESGGKTIVKVAFYNNDGTAGTLLPAVAVDFENFQQVTNDVTTIDVSGLSAGAVTLTNVPYTAAGDLVGVKTSDPAVDYYPRYTLGSANKITIPAGAANATSGTKWTYAVTASDKVAATGLRTYSIKEGEALVGDPVGPCFVVTKAVDASGNVTYEFSYTAGSADDALDTLGEACWANGVTVDAATNVAPITGKTVTIKAATGLVVNGQAKYTVSAQNGVIVTDVTDKVTGSWTTAKTTTIGYYNTDGTKLDNITLVDCTAKDQVNYWKVEKLNDGNNEIKITKVSATAISELEENTNYIKVVNGTTAGSTQKQVTVTYVKTNENSGTPDKENVTPDIQLYNLVNGTLPVKFQTPDGFTGTEIILPEAARGNAACVDAQVTAPAGTTITNKGDGDSVVWIPKFKNAAVIDLDKLAGSDYATEKTYYYTVTATAADKLDEEGYRTVTIASETPATTAPAATENYFAVTKDKSGVYTVTYHVGTGTGATPMVLFAGKATLQVNGNEAIKSITETVSGNAGDKYFVDKATDSLTTLKENSTDVKTTTGYVEYVPVSRWLYDSGTEIALSGWDGTSPLPYSITRTGGDLAAQGVTKYTLKQEAVTNGTGKAGITFTYTAPTTTTDGNITITLAQGTVLTKAEIEAIANSIKINAKLHDDIKGKVAKIVLTPDSTTAISYDITNLSADVGLENFTDGKDTVTYAASYVMGDANTITLTKGTGTASTVYYAVTATTGDKNVKTVSIATTPIEIKAGATPAEIAEALDKAGGNYFKVHTYADGAVNVSYTSKDIDLADLKINVDASAVTAKDADIDAGDSGASQIITIANTGKALYTVSGLDVGQTANKKSGTADVTSKYNTSYAVTYDQSALDDGLNTAIVLGSYTTGTYYYEVNRVSAAQGVEQFKVRVPVTAAAPSSGHYFAVKYAATGITVTYYNVDGDTKYNLADVMGTAKQVAVNAAGINEAITAINIADGGSADTPTVNYALQEVSPDVEIVGKGEGDTVTTKPTVVWADGQKLTLTDFATAYYTITGTADAKGNVTMTIGEGSETKPADTANYFVVTRTQSSTTGKVSYAITSYHPSNGDAAYDLSGAKVGTLTIDAAKATGGIDLNNGTRVARYAVTNLPEFYVPSNMSSETDLEDTVAYSTTFAWPTETVPKDSNGGKQTYTYQYLVKAAQVGTSTDYKGVVTPGETTSTTVTDATTQYVLITVTKDSDGVYTISNSSDGGTDYKTFKGDGTTGALAATTNTAQVTSIVAPTTAAEIDASGVTFVQRVTTVGSEVTPEITDVVAGSKVYLKDENDVTIVSAALTANDAITIIDKDAATTPHVYTAGDAGTIAVNYNDGTLKVESGVLVLGAGETLTAYKAAADGLYTVASLTKGSGDGDGKVVLTFDATKGITSITGLEVGETLTVTEGTPGTAYTYTLDNDGYVVKTLYTDSSDQTCAAGSATTNVLGLGYETSYPPAAIAVGKFEWGQTKATYYLSATDTAATIAYNGSSTGTVTSTGTYIKAEYKASVLYLTPMKGNAKGLLDPITDYAGTITLQGDAAGTVIKYAKDKDATYTVNVVNAKNGSTFTDLGSSDTVTTVSLAETNTIVMQFTDSTGKVDAAKTATYTAKVAGAMEFHGAALYNGSVTLASGSGTLTLSDGATVTSTAGTDQTLVVENGSIKTLKDLGTSKKVTIKQNGATIVIESDSNGTGITKTVTAADGSVTKTTYTVVKDANVWDVAGTTTFTNNFTWGNEKNTGYFVVNGNGAATVENSTAADQKIGDNGTLYVKATITKVDATTANNTFTLTPMIVKNGVMTEATAAEVGTKIKVVTVTGVSTPATGTLMTYDGTGKTYNINLTGAAAGSTFTNLKGGDVVTSGTLTATQKISVNGQDWTAPTGGTTFKIYSESPQATRIVNGALALTATNNTVNAATVNETEATSTATQTMTYTAGTDNKDGVSVTYTAGVPTSITGLDLGESVRIDAVGTDGKKVVTEYTTAKGTESGKTVIYRTRGGVVTVKEITNAAEVVDETAVDSTTSAYQSVKTEELKAFDWTKDGAGQFLVTDGKAEAANRTSAISTDYTQYGKTYLVATVSGNTVQLQKAVVGMTGALGTAGNIVATDKMDVTLTLPTAGLKITTLTGRDNDTTQIKSLTIVNAAKDTVIGTWTANDHITTVSLAEGDKITLGTSPSAATYTAGKAGALEVEGTYAKNGTFRLTNTVTTIDAKATDATTEAVTVDAVTYTANGTSDTADIGVTNGRVTSLTSFGAGETVKVSTTVTDKFGVEKTTNATYTATLETEGLNKGQIKVTMSTDDGTSYTHTFKDTKQNILDESVTWNVVGQDVSESLFNWDNTGYFAAKLWGTTDAEKAKKIYELANATDTGTSVMAQTTAPTFKNENKEWLAGAYYLRVTASKAMSGLVTISDISLVQLQSNGTFAAVKAGETIPTLAINAAATGGLALPEHTGTKLAITPKMGATYSGLVEGDKISATATDGQTITVNSKAYSLKAGDFTINGDNTITKGTFVVSDTATSAKAAKDPWDVYVKKVTVTGDGSPAVTVNFTEKGIQSVTDLQAGETVVVEEGGGTGSILDKTITFTAEANKPSTGKTTVTQKIEFANTKIPTAAELVKSDDVANITAANVLDMAGYTTKNKFDFGATTAGQVGMFRLGDNTAVSGTIKVQDTAGTITATNGDRYLFVAASGDATKGYTITSVWPLSYNSANGRLDDLKTSTLTGGVTIVAPTGASLTLGKDAVLLYTKYKDGDDGTRVIDTTETETERGFGFNVTGASAGKSYTDFTKLDTITAGALKADDTITVGSLTYTVKSDAAAGTVSFYGNGAAQAGEFKFSGKEVQGYDGATLTSVTGAAEATVLFAAGKLSSITEIGAGETITVVETNTATNAAKTTKYTATALSSGNIRITREVTEDGVTTTDYGTSTGDSSNITKLTYTDASATISSNFDWTAEKGSGYFFADVTLDGTAIKDIGAIELKPGTTTITAADAGKYVVKAEVTTDGKVDSLALYKVQANGELGDPITIPTTATGTVAITAPTVKTSAGATVPLNFDKTNYPKLTVSITGAAAGSNVKALTAGDSLTTATLAKAVAKTDTTAAKAAETVTVNDQVYTAGADGVLKFVDADVLTDGAIAMTGTYSVSATGAVAGKYSATTLLTVAHAGDGATAVVTFKDGVVSAIDGLTTDTVTISTPTTGTNASAMYGLNAVTVTMNKADTSLTTMAMAEGDTVTFAGKALQSGAANNKLEFVMETGSSSNTNTRVKNGVIRLSAANDSFTAAGSSTAVTTDNVTMTYTTKTATISAVNAKVTNGVITSITGLGAGDKVTLADAKTPQTTTTYEIDATTPTKITKTVSTTGSDAVKYTAFITAGATADILAANYFGEGQDITEEENQIVGQLSWADVSGRSTGYFEMNESTKVVKPIAEQTAKVTVTAKKGKTATYAVANVKDSEDSAHVQTLSIDALQVQTSSDGKTTTVVSSGVKLLAGATITVTAPTTAVDGIIPPISYDKGTGTDAPTYAITLNKVAANSVIKNIDLGDKVNTATLKAETTTTPAQYVTMVETDGTEVAYIAGANGTMTFVGEGESAQATYTGVARLLTGTVRLINGASIYLAGGADDRNKTYSGTANDLKVTATNDSNVIVKVAKGVISTVTGLDTLGATLEVATGTSESATSVKYTVVDVDTTAKTIMIERVAGKPGDYAADAAKTYRTVKTTADFYAGDQTKTFKAMEQETPTLTDWTTAGTKYAFVNTADLTTGGTAVFTTTAAKTAGVTSDVITAAFSAVPNTKYYRLTAKTAANGMTTISAVDAMEADAASKTGKLVVSKSATVSGILAINGATANPATGETNGKISFTLPATTKRSWTLNATNLALGSVITGLTKSDVAVSGDGTFNLTKSTKTFTVYTAGAERGTSTQVVTYAGSDAATAKVTGGVLTITGLSTEKEKVTVVTDTDTQGLVTAEYQVKGGLIQRTLTAADGTKTVCTSKTAPGELDILNELEWNDPTETTIVSDFNWTLDRSQVGYFAVNTSRNEATARTQKTPIATAAQKALTYIAVELDGTKTGYEGRDGVVKSIKAMTFNATTGAMEEAAAGSFAGKITIMAPTAALVFDRAAVGTSISDNAQIVITNAAAGSEISGLKARAAYANSDSVTTAKLTGRVWNANGTEKTAGSTVTINDLTYVAGANGALGFTMQQVNGTDDERVTLTSGTVSLTAGTTEGPNAVIVGKTGIVANNAITVAASTKVSRGVANTTYTIGDLGENESFQVLTYSSETVTATFKKSNSALFYKADGAADDGTEGKYIYALNGKTSVGSSALAISGNVPTAKGWQAVKETFTEGTDGFLTTTYGAVTVDLKTLDSRYKADANAKNGSPTYAYVIDKYLASSAKAAKALNAAVVRAQDTDIQTLIGNVTGATGTWRSYTANTVVGQNIKATANWNVFGSNAADTITGASSGSDLLSGGEGNDSLVGGNAADTFIVGEGRDTIKGFGNGKDAIAGFAFNKWALSGTNVELWTDSTADDTYGSDENGVTLLNMGTKKAVNINGTNYYFGNGNAKKAETFTFDVSSKEQSAAAKYYGKAGLANTLSVGTDKTKATAKTLGDTLVVDLSNQTSVDEKDAARYFNIASADATKSANRVDLTATATGSTLKGGTYESTLRGGAGSDMLYGGSGVDVFWAADLSGSDTVKSYQTSKDAVFLGNIDADPDTATEVNDFTIQASGKNVILTKGDASMTVEGAAASTAKAFVLSKDGTSKNTLSYYVGNATARANKFTATMDVDMKSVTTEDVTNVTMSSYYLGSSATNVDTLTLKSTTKNAAIGKFDMNALAKYISTIDVIDTASLAKGSTIELIGRESGTYTLKGNNNVNETFNLKNLAAETTDSTNRVTVTNLGVGEVIELATGVKVSMATSGKNTICTLKDSSDNSLGTLTISGVASTKLSYSETTGKLTRTTK